MAGPLVGIRPSVDGCATERGGTEETEARCSSGTSGTNGTSGSRVGGGKKIRMARHDRQTQRGRHFQIDTPRVICQGIGTRVSDDDVEEGRGQRGSRSVWASRVTGPRVDPACVDEGRWSTLTAGARGP